jgi:predicted metal-binding membrane protein
MSRRMSRRDRLIILVSLAAATLLAWAWIVPMSRDMYGPMSGPSAWMMTAEWDAHHLALLFAMWIVMMAGMMLPSATPVMMLFAGAARHNEPARATTLVSSFAAGYLIVWTAFAIAAALLQRVLTEALILTPMMEPATKRAASVVLALAGLYQITPFKRACLTACQSPVTFVTKHWRPGVAGALHMGLVHGASCLGCCWALMLLLFAGGVMHLPTIVMLTVLVLAEKLVPPGAPTRWFTWATGLMLLGLAASMVV